MDHKFTEQVGLWLNSHEDERDYTFDRPFCHGIRDLSMLSDPGGLPTLSFTIHNTSNNGYSKK